MTRIHPIEKIRLIDWLASPRGPRPAAYLRKFRPRMSVRFALAVRSTLSGRPAGPRRFESLYLPSTPFVKVVALRHYAKIFGPRVFVETGTFLGDTTAAVADLFERWKEKQREKNYGNDDNADDGARAFPVFEPLEHGKVIPLRSR